MFDSVNSSWGFFKAITRDKEGSSDSTSGYISKESPNHNLKGYVHPYVHCSTIYNSQDMEVTHVPVNRKVDKKAVVHTYGGILLDHKKE